MLNEKGANIVCLCFVEVLVVSVSMCHPILKAEPTCDMPRKFIKTKIKYLLKIFNDPGIGSKNSSIQYITPSNN